MTKAIGTSGVFLAAAVIAACGSKQKAATAPVGAAAQQKGGAEVHEQIHRHTCPARTKLAELLGRKEPPPAPHPEQTADSAPPPTSTVGNARIAASQVYRSVAPETVLIRTDQGMGTGVVIDPKGYILTNNHVVMEGRKKDFVITVGVTFGDMSATGRMTRQEKSYDAVVVKDDPIRDLAILRVKEPPPKLTAVKLAKSAPQIAERVMSIGHAGIGFLWAAKSCNIASIGERQQDASRLAALDCGSADPALSPADATRYKERCSAAKKEMTDALSSSTQGLALQTDCAITHGDSGGPLVNATGELVGLNQSIASDLATASFHVHLDEIKDFIAKYPEEGIAIPPDPFCDGGSTTSLEDLDQDGVADTLVTLGSQTMLGGYDRMSLLIDLDQNHSAKKGSPEESFDGEIALLVTREGTYVWYDTNDDGRFDLLLVDKDSDGEPELAYRLDTEGRPTLDKDALPKHDLSAKYVKDASLHARLGKIAAAIGGAKYASSRIQAASAKAVSIPDPILGGGTEGRLLDTDGDGTPDVAVMRSAFSRAFIIDADEDSMRGMKAGDPADGLVKSHSIDAELSIVVQANAVWALYDTDNDRRFDLALMTANGADPSALFATQAFRIAANGEKTPALDQLGRKVLRPGLLPTFSRIPTALGLLESDVAENEGLGSLPDPKLGNKARFRARDIAGIPNATILEAQSGAWGTTLFDVDHSTKVPKEPDYQALVKDGKLDAEVAVVHQSGPEGGSDWIFYDTDNDGAFDLVLFVAKSGDEVTQAYRVVKGVLEADPKAVPGKTFRTKSVFKDKALAAKWKTIAMKIYRPSSIED